MHLDEVGGLRLALGIPLPVGGDVGEDGEQDEGELQSASIVHQSRGTVQQPKFTVTGVAAPEQQTLSCPTYAVLEASS
jgi:hypothetical protein